MLPTLGGWVLGEPAGRVPRGRVTVMAVAALLVSACGHDFEPPERGGRVEAAAAMYTPSLFDSISWVAEDIRLTDGNTVYAEECRRCHGPLGRGETDYARERRLTVPTLVDPEWHLADLDSIRRSIFVGHEAAMPLYGEGDLTPRQIDAVSAYIIFVLRPEVIEGG